MAYNIFNARNSFIQEGIGRPQSPRGNRLDSTGIKESVSSILAKIPYSGKLSREKTFANRWEGSISRRKLSRNIN